MKEVVIANPCPFCKGITIGVKDTLTGGHKVWAYCSKCGRLGRKIATPEGIDDDELINLAYKAWNEDIDGNSNL